MISLHNCTICQIIENDEELEGEEDMKVKYVHKRIRDYYESMNPSSDAPSKTCPRVICRRLADYVNRNFVRNEAMPDIVMDLATPEMIRNHCLRHSDAPKVRLLNMLCQLMDQGDGFIEEQPVAHSKIKSLITSVKDIIVSLK